MESEQAVRARDVLIVMTRLPRDGANKTRLIPVLGAAGATDFHNRLVRHTVGRVSSYVMMQPGTRMQVHIEGGTLAEGRAWLGDADVHVQPEGDLGKRMQTAVELAFSQGARRVVVTGTDCPSMDESLIEKAYDLLNETDLVFGPAADGGYYLVGLSRPCPAIFIGIEWGGSQVLAQSLAVAENCGFQSSILDVLSDVDLPEDLPAANVALDLGTTLSVIIPILNEELRISEQLDRLKQCAPYEIIVVDGGGHDWPVGNAKQAGVLVISAHTDTALLMNSVAAMVTGEFLLFLNAGILPALDCQQLVARVLQTPAESAGVFRVGFKGESSITPLTGSPVHLCAQFLDMSHAIEGLLMRRRIFQYALNSRTSLT